MIHADGWEGNHVEFSAFLQICLAVEADDVIVLFSFLHRDPYLLEGFAFSSGFLLEPQKSWEVYSQGRMKAYCEG